jgi:hypothetical protein
MVSGGAARSIMGRRIGEMSMRRIVTLPALAVLLLLAGGGVGEDVVVLKDGRTLEIMGTPVTKGRIVLLKMRDGTLCSIPADEIDGPKTEAARAKPAPTPASKAESSLRPPRPAEIAGKKSERKAAVALTDEQVAKGQNEDVAEKKDEDQERVDVTNAAATKSPSGYSITGSVLNSGNVDVSGISVTIEGVAGGKTVATTFGQVAKDQLAPGEKSTFTAEMKETADIQTFRYVARWQTKVAVKSAVPSDWGGGVTPPPKPPEGADAAKTEGAGEKSAEPTPVPTPRLVRIPSPDVPAPPANAPIGKPDKPGGTFLPQPTGDQPKPPGGN